MKLATQSVSVGLLSKKVLKVNKSINKVVRTNIYDLKVKHQEVMCGKMAV